MTPQVHSLCLVYSITLFQLPSMESVLTAFVIIWIFSLDFNPEHWQKFTQTYHHLQVLAFAPFY